MSRIGKLPIAIPDKVDVKINGSHVAVKGTKGQLEFTFSSSVEIKVNGKEISIVLAKGHENEGAQWGTARAVLNNMVQGVSKGFIRNLEFNGVGYKAAVSGNIVTLNLGYSHPVEYALPAGVTAKVNKNVIELEGINKELLGFVASKIRSFRSPEPYKGKGIKYVEETILRKAGKTGGKK